MQSITSERHYTPRVNRGGNYCGHDPHAPKFPQVINRLLEANLHPLQKVAINNLKNYYRSPSILEKLGRIKANGELRSRRKDGGFRKVRTDQADMNIMVMAFLIGKVNLMKLQVGVVPYHDPDGLYGPTETQIASALNESVVRVRRALAHWKNAGYLTITQRRRPRQDGEGWESLSPVFCVKETVFVLVGVSKKWLRRTRDWKSKAWKSERNRRFQKAVEKERDLYQAKQREAQDFFLQDLMRRVEELPNKQKAWQQRQSDKQAHDPPDPPHNIH